MDSGYWAGYYRRGLAAVNRGAGRRGHVREMIVSGLGVVG